MWVEFLGIGKRELNWFHKGLASCATKTASRKRPFLLLSARSTCMCTLERRGWKFLRRDGRQQASAVADLAQVKPDPMAFAHLRALRFWAFALHGRCSWFPSLSERSWPWYCICPGGSRAGSNVTASLLESSSCSAPPRTHLESRPWLRTGAGANSDGPLDHATPRGRYERPLSWLVAICLLWSPAREPSICNPPDVEYDFFGLAFPRSVPSGSHTSLRDRSANRRFHVLDCWTQSRKRNHGRLRALGSPSWDSEDSHTRSRGGRHAVVGICWRHWSMRRWVSLCVAALCRKT